MNDDMPSGGQAGRNDLLFIKLNIGDALQLQDISPPEQRYYVKLIGYLGRRSVLVTHPLQDEKLLPVKEGQSFLVRGFSTAMTYEFSADVVSVCLSPYPYLHLSFPDQVKSFNMRNALRIKLKLACLIEVQGASLLASKMPTNIENISAFGALVRSGKELGKVGDNAILSFRLPVDEEGQLFTVPAIIRNVHTETAGETNEESVVNHGLEFLRTEGWDHLALQNFIYKTIAEG